MNETLGNGYRLKFNPEIADKKFQDLRTLKFYIMIDKQYVSGNFQDSHYDETNLLFQKVLWTEDGITHLGTVTKIYTIKGMTFLSVMTIFGKRHAVKKSKVRLYTEQLRA